MGRVLVLTGDLLFGSRVQAALAGAGHEVELLPDGERLQGALDDPGAGPATVVVLDLTDDSLDGVEVARGLAAAGRLRGVGTLAFYSHVDTEIRARAEAAGLDLVVPRSRMAREGPDLVARVAEGAGRGAQA